MPVAAVELDAWLGGPHLQTTAAVRLYAFDCIRELARLTLVQYIAVVVTRSVLDLLVVGSDAFANGVRFTEVEGCACHLQYLARWNTCLVNGKIEVGIYL